MLITWFTLWYSVLKHSKVPSLSEIGHVRTVSNEKRFQSAVAGHLQEYSAGVSPAFDAVANGFPDSGSCFSGILKWVSQ
ncbi:hypothetical protein CEXT_258571 [Caerostris extrusa]|uniref:Uncharacterized protein n=1 Tax=Caerostris extrusa TaxID=172846 RepID=A0AAV4TDT6_CAEEX|nr:hypothetical protein CEXT_258571 [Caerostris extrusa]